MCTSVLHGNVAFMINTYSTQQTLLLELTGTWEGKSWCAYRGAFCCSDIAWNETSWMQEQRMCRAFQRTQALENLTPCRTQIQNNWGGKASLGTFSWLFDHLAIDRKRAKDTSYDLFHEKYFRCGCLQSVTWPTALQKSFLGGSWCCSARRPGKSPVRKPMCNPRGQGTANRVWLTATRKRLLGVAPTLGKNQLWQIIPFKHFLIWFLGIFSFERGI